MKEKTYLFFVTWAGHLSFLSTCILSIMACWILFGANLHTTMGIFFIPIAVMVGASINVAEVIFWIRYINLKKEYTKLQKILEISTEKDNSEMLSKFTKSTMDKQLSILKSSMNKSLYVTFFSAFLSVSASFAVFYTTYEHGKHLGRISEMQLNSIAARDATASEYKHLAKERERIAKERTLYTSHYLDRAALMVAKSDSVLQSKAEKLDALKLSTKDNMAMSLYKSYANLGGSPDFWASAINLFFVVLIECVMLALSAENHRIYLKRQDELKGKRAVDSLYENMNLNLDPHGNLQLEIESPTGGNGHSSGKKKDLKPVVVNSDGDGLAYAYSGDEYYVPSQVKVWKNWNEATEMGIKKSYAQIGREVGCSPEWVKKALILGKAKGMIKDF